MCCIEDPPYSTGTLIVAIWLRIIFLPQGDVSMTSEPQGDSLSDTASGARSVRACVRHPAPVNETTETNQDEAITRASYAAGW